MNDFVRISILSLVLLVLFMHVGSVQADNMGKGEAFPGLDAKSSYENFAIYFDSGSIKELDFIPRSLDSGISIYYAPYYRQLHNELIRLQSPEERVSIDQLLVVSKGLLQLRQMLRDKPCYQNNLLVDEINRSLPWVLSEHVLNGQFVDQRIHDQLALLCSDRYSVSSWETLCLKDYHSSPEFELRESAASYQKLWEHLGGTGPVYLSEGADIYVRGALYEQFRPDLLFHQEIQTEALLRMAMMTVKYKERKGDAFSIHDNFAQIVDIYPPARTKRFKLSSKGAIVSDIEIEPQDNWCRLERIKGEPFSAMQVEAFLKLLIKRMM